MLGNMCEPFMRSAQCPAARATNRATALLLIVLLGACASNTPLQRPQPGSLVLGSTSYQETRARFGATSRTKNLQIRGRRIQSVSYTYSDPQTPAYKVPTAETVRGLYLYFHQGVLVGYNYISSFPSDHTDFDQSMISGLVEGKSREAEVIARFGAPSGESMYPLTRHRGLRHLVYSYVQFIADPFGHGDYSSKTLVITVDRSGLVRDLDYKEEGLSC